MSASKSSPNYHQKAAYGGENWSPRIKSHREEIGSIWASSGLNSEWAPLKQVLLHPPGSELVKVSDPEHAQMLEIPDWELAHHQHQTIAQIYRENGVAVQYVEPQETSPPNLIFCADLFFMTPEGAILARPASTVRAGEERMVARRLADLGIPILRTLTGQATFEGADAHWLDSETVLIGRGFRTNAEGIQQVTATLGEIGVETISVDSPIGSMHLMGILRFLDHDIAITWPYRLAWTAIEALRERGFRILFIPDETEATQGGGLNFVTLGPRKILMAAGNPKTQAYLEAEGVACQTVKVSELLKAAGGIGCLTGILERTIV
jgi:N-dimethylarginine dimethylaminohydrolase